MKEESHSTDGTVVFIPERLNRDPVVIRGMTNDEMFWGVGTGCIFGLCVGVPVFFLTGQLALIPTFTAIGGGIALFAGGSLLRKAKRNRPDTWLYRTIQLNVLKRFGMGNKQLVIRTGWWSIRRHRRAETRSTRSNQA